MAPLHAVPSASLQFALSIATITIEVSASGGGGGGGGTGRELVSGASGEIGRHEERGKGDEALGEVIHAGKGQGGDGTEVKCDDTERKGNDEEGL